jgi:hypothetical protein
MARRFAAHQTTDVGIELVNAANQKGIKRSACPGISAMTDFVELAAAVPVSVRCRSRSKRNWPCGNAAQGFEML